VNQKEFVNNQGREAKAYDANMFMHAIE